jgi:hypothetical protein
LHGRALPAGLPTSSGQQGEGFDVSWPHDGEVTAVEGGDAVDAESFGDGDEGCVGAAKS